MPLLPVSQLEHWSPLFRGKTGRAFAGWVRKVLSMSALSDAYDEAALEGEGAVFARALLKVLDVEYQIGHAELLDRLPDGPFIAVANHPYGGLDGVILIDMLGNRREGFKVMANEILNHAVALTPSLIIVNPATDDSAGVTAQNIKGVKEVLRQLSDGRPIGLFPSGAVSDLHFGEIRDREWQPSVLRLIQKAKVPVLPVRFFDHNTAFFYLLGLINWRVRVLLLPHEVVNKHGQSPRVGIGPLISVEEQAACPDLAAFGQLLRSRVYDMPLPDSFTPANTR